MLSRGIDAVLFPVVQEFLQDFLLFSSLKPTDAILRPANYRVLTAKHYGEYYSWELIFFVDLSFVGANERNQR